MNENLEESLDNGDSENEESYENEDVRYAGDGPLEQFLLPENLGGLNLKCGGHRGLVTRHFVSRTNQLDEELGSTGRKNYGDQDDGDSHTPTQCVRWQKLLHASSRH